MQWTYSDKIFAEIDPAKSIRVRGRKASGRYQLRLELSPLMQPRLADQTVQVLWLSGSLSSQDSEISLLSLAEPCTLRTATTAYSGDGSIVLAADLSYRQVHHMNESRAGNGSLALRFNVWGHANGPGGIERIYGHDALTVSNESWIAVLQETDFAETLLIEVVAPRLPADPKLTGAVKALSEARTRLVQERRGNDAVSDCRHVLDAIKPIPPLPKGVAITCEEGRNIKALTLPERLALLQFALRHASHLPHHGKDDDFHLVDARLVVQLTAVLLEHELRRAEQY